MNDDKILDMLERENLHLADKGVRTLAWFIDVFLLSIIFTLIHLDTFKQLSDTQGNIDYYKLRDFMGLYAWQVWILKVSYDSFFVWYYGSSIGKILCKIRVVSVDLLDKPSFFMSFVRACGKYIGENLLFITYLFGFADRFSRTLHDRLAKTLVITY
ncbi:RDD family protein [Helicobacter jaachi]|uniref:RDD family protein n=1 Tax=Helicobacter jaachi TaxID=1677920 RepID=A0A4U8TAS9_9HELI|nr:RDD family protein [Helicobacter jaachi]TLD96823.1 RDD family protein [Helicobacter jaachi]